MEYEFYNYDEVSTSSLVPEGDYDVIIEKAEGKADSNNKIRIYYTARILNAYDPKNSYAVGFRIYGQPQVKMPGDPEYFGKELKQIIEAAHIPYTKSNNGSIRFDTDNWFQREMTITVKHTKNESTGKVYANPTNFREKAQPVQASAPSFAQPQAQQYVAPQQMAQPQFTQPQNAQPMQFNQSMQTPPQPMWGQGSKRS